MVYKILISILCLLRYAVSQTVDLTGNCSVSFPPEPFFVTGVDRPPLSCQLYGTSSCSNGDLPASVGGPFMGPPGFLSLDFPQFSYDGKKYPKLEVTWTPPITAAGISELKGFYIYIHKLAGVAGPKSFCRVFDFSQNNFTAGDHKLQFTKTFVQLSGGSNYLYMMDLYTLPYSSSDSEKLRNVFTLQAVSSVNNTADWRASMSYSKQNLSAPAQVSIEFSLAPARFNFKKYEILLIDLRDDENYLLKCIVHVEESYECQGKVFSPPNPNVRKMTHTFYDIQAGNYSVRVKAYDPYWQQDDRCLCFQEQGQHRHCMQCATTLLNGSIESIFVGGASAQPTSAPTASSAPTMTSTMASETDSLRGESAQPTSAPTASSGPTMTSTMASETDSLRGESAQPTSAPTASSTPTMTSTMASETDSLTPIVDEVKKPEDNSMLVVAAVLGSMMSLFLVVQLGFYLWRRRRIYIPPSSKANNKPTTQLELTKKKICIVNSSDHPGHVKVVERLARYLNEHCACQVFFMPWFQGETQTHGCYEWILNHINISDYVLIINSEAAFKLYEARNNNTSFRMEDRGPEDDVFLVAMSHVMARRNQSDFYKRNILTYFEYTTEDFLLKDFGPGIQYKLPKHLKELLCHIHEVESYSIDPRLFTINEFADIQSKPEGRALMEAITKAKTFQKINPFWFAKNFHRQDFAYDSSSSPELDQEPDSVSTGPRFNYPPVNDEESKSTITYNTNYAKFHDPEAMSAVTYNSHYKTNNPSFFPLAPSTVVTTEAPTELINDQLASINHQGVSNQAFSYNNFGENTPDDFIPPSEVLEDDIEEQLMNINRESLTPSDNLDPAYQFMHPANEDLDPSSIRFYPGLYENRAGPQNIPETWEDNDSNVGDGRDV